jgi:hypothetical protein
MSVKGNLAYLANNSSNLIKMASEMIPHIKKRLKKYNEEEMREAMKDDEKMNKLAEDLYQHLPSYIKIKVKEDEFLKFIIANKQKLMKRKSAKKKVYGK